MFQDHFGTYHDNVPKLVQNFEFSEVAIPNSTSVAYTVCHVRTCPIYIFVRNWTISNELYNGNLHQKDFFHGKEMPGGAKMF